MYNKKCVRNIPYHNINSWGITKPNKLKLNKVDEDILIKTNQLTKIQNALQELTWNMYYYIHCDNSLNSSL